MKIKTFVLTSTYYKLSIYQNLKTKTVKKINELALLVRTSAYLLAQF